MSKRRTRPTDDPAEHTGASTGPTATVTFPASVDGPRTTRGPSTFCANPSGWSTSPTGRAGWRLTSIIRRRRGRHRSDGASCSPTATDNGVAHRERCESGRIGSTGNAVAHPGPWVRIPPSPPERPRPANSHDRPLSGRSEREMPDETFSRVVQVVPGTSLQERAPVLGQRGGLLRELWLVVDHHDRDRVEQALSRVDRLRRRSQG